jgi:hypothetical protein
MKRATVIRATTGMIAGVAAALLAYVRVIRPWHLRWGASTEEVQQPMPGDDLVPDATLIATRAITIAAPASAVWPWLVQMGYRRAGWYSYDFIDKDGVHVGRIIPELQYLSVGDTLLTGPTGGFRVEELNPERLLVLLIRGERVGLGGDISAAIVLEPLEEHHTRLILRLRARFSGIRGRLFGLLFDLGDFVMMRKMLLGVKQRAEVAVMHQLAM